jgi:hypothetical protein
LQEDDRQRSEEEGEHLLPDQLTSSPDALARWTEQRTFC